jgi:hypothetical protein
MRAFRLIRGTAFAFKLLAAGPTKPVVHRNSLRLGAFAVIGILPDEARSPIRIDVAMLRPVQILGTATINNLYGNPLVCRFFGFEGSSVEHGGYINRGFDDSSRSTIATCTQAFGAVLLRRPLAAVQRWRDDS